MRFHDPHTAWMEILEECMERGPRERAQALAAFPARFWPRGRTRRVFGFLHVTEGCLGRLGDPS